MQLGDPGLELERVFAHPRTKPLGGDELALLAFIQRRDNIYFPPPVRNPDNPIRYLAAPWSGKDIFNTRDVLNKRAHTIIAQNAVRSQDFAREVLIHMGFTFPEVIAREKIAMGAPMQLSGLEQDFPTAGVPWSEMIGKPTTQTIPVLTTQQPARTIRQAAPPPVKTANAAALIPWALLALSVFRTLR